MRYLGWAIPEAVYVDFDVIAGAPAALNRAGVGDILCYHTAHLDWRLTPRARPEERAVAVRRAARGRGARTARRRPGCARRHPRRHRRTASGRSWRPTAGAARRSTTRAGTRATSRASSTSSSTTSSDRTGRHFIHGQPVGLGIVLGSVLQESGADEMVAALARAGVDIRPEAMGVTLGRRRGGDVDAR